MVADMHIHVSSSATSTPGLNELAAVMLMNPSLGSNAVTQAACSLVQATLLI